MLLVLGAALRLWRLDAQSLWIDELFTWNVARWDHGLGTLWGLVLDDFHPPLYYLLLHGWFGLAGDSPVAARLPSALCGVLTVAAAVVFYRPLLAPGRHLVFVLLVALSYGGIYFAQEARSYALLLLLAVAATAAALRLALLRASTDERAWNRAATLLAVTSLVAAYTHYFGVVLAVAAFGATVLSAGQWRRAVKLVAAGLLVALAFVPWLAVDLPHVAGRTGGHFWIGEGSGWYGWNLAWFVKLGFGRPATVLLLVAGAPVLLRRRVFDAAVWLPALACVVGAAFVALVDVHTTVTTGRNLIVFLPFLYLLAAAIVAEVGDAARRWTRGVGGLAYTLALIIPFVEPLGYYFTAVHKAQWRESAADVLADPRCRDGTLPVYGDPSYYRYFVRRAGAHPTLLEVPRADTGAPPPPAPLHRGGCPVLLWAAHLERDELDGTLRRMGTDPDAVEVTGFNEAFVVRARSR